MFKVYTEDVGGNTAEGIAAQYFDGFALFRGIGCWRGTFEKTQCFELDTSDSRVTAERVYDFAAALKEALGQTAVLVVELHSTSVLV